MPFTVRATLLAAITAVTVLAVAQRPCAQLPPGLGGSAFVRFDDQLRKPHTAVVIGELSRITLGKRERMRDGDADLGVGGVVQKVAGTVFYEVQCRATVAVRQALQGTSAKSLPVAFAAQASKQPDGSDQLLFLTTPKWKADAGLLALYVVARDERSKQWEVRAVVPMDARVDRGPDPEKAFLVRAADVFALNQRLAHLAAALDEAPLHEAHDGAAAAAKLLRAALDEELVLRQPESESPRTMLVAPLEQRVREALHRFEGAGAERHEGNGDAGGGKGG